MRRLELAVNAIWLVLGLAVCATSFNLGIIGPGGPDSGFFPLIAGVAMAGGAALLAVLPGERISTDETFLPPDGSARRVITVLAIMVAIVAALPWIGFAMAAIIGMPLLLRTIGNPGWLFSILFGLASTLAVVFVFDRLLGMSLPRGPFGF